MKEIDWEQRRYEIAKDVFCIQEAQYLDSNRKMAEVAVRAADALIEELKNKQMKAIKQNKSKPQLSELEEHQKPLDSDISE